MSASPKADKFGKLLMIELRDATIDFWDGLARGHWKAACDQPIQARLANLNDEQRAVAREAVIRALDYGIHNFLFALGVAADFQQGISVIVDGTDIIVESDGLHTEPTADDGWIVKYSNHQKGTV